MQTKEHEHITGVVLAGGRARRMGGANKALVSYRGRPLYRYAVDNLKTCCEKVIINTHRDTGVFIDAGFDVIGDGEFTDCGPIAGLLAAFSNATTSYVAIAPCDQLELPASVYRLLAAEANEKRGAYACSGDDQIPTCAVFPTSLAVAARHALEAQSLALLPFAQAQAIPVQFDDVVFANINALPNSE